MRKPRDAILDADSSAAAWIHPKTAREPSSWQNARLNELIKGKRGVTAEAALDLAEALGTSPRLWMNLQATYDLSEAAKKRWAA